MSFDDVALRLGVPLATFLWCIASGVVPLVNAEVFLVGVAAVVPPSSLWLLAPVAALGQMTAKCLMYLGGRGVVRLPTGNRREAVEAARRRVERWRSKDLLVFVSATLGVPPFFAIPILAGSLGFPFGRFLVAGFGGRLLRFSLLLAIPPLGRWLAG